MLPGELLLVCTYIDRLLWGRGSGRCQTLCGEESSRPVSTTVLDWNNIVYLNFCSFVFCIISSRTSEFRLSNVPNTKSEH